nr:hypothetical protein BaRGS_033792 [Batillaria attramentaria]
MGKEFVESGESIYLLCNTTEGNRIPDDVDWFKDGTKINKREFPHIIITKYRELENTALVSELIIDRGKRKDSGTYICRNSIDQLASLEVTVLVAESTNIKRGKSMNSLSLSLSLCFPSFCLFLCHTHARTHHHYHNNNNNDNNNNDDDDNDDNDNNYHHTMQKPL